MLDNFFKRKDDEKRVRNEGRLPPGQSLTVKFPVLHYGPVPRFNPATWDLRVWGEVEKETRWTWDEFNQLPRTQILMDIHCVTRWSKFDTTWEGVSVRTLIDQGLIKLLPPLITCCSTPSTASPLIYLWRWFCRKIFY
jgi:DMSO/TMAO reductase YedYZ molybdopterin-dependent catalytic subunit